MSYDSVIEDVESKMEKAIEVFSNESRGIRSGRATPGLVENIRVDYYGSPTPLKQIASISVPEPRLLVIKPYDRNSIKNIEKAILKSDLGLTPNSDVALIRLSVPALSEERRKQLVNQVKDIAEKAKVSIRNIRREGNKKLDQEKESSVISEDLAKTGKDDIQDLTKKYEEKVNKLLEEKRKEILEG